MTLDESVALSGLSFLICEMGYKERARQFDRGRSRFLTEIFFLVSLDQLHTKSTSACSYEEIRMDFKEDI